jgi:cytochrome c-type protein NapB
MKKILLTGLVGVMLLTSQLYAAEIKGIDKKDLNISTLPALPAHTVSLSNKFAAMPNIASCFSCHGTKFSKKAFGKSKIVENMKNDTVYKELIEYKKGKLNQYGMGSLMTGQVSKFSDAELKTISKHIAKD